MTLYFFPTIPDSGGGNPYSANFKNTISQYFVLADDSRIPSALNYPLLHFSFRSDVFVLNWVESVIFSDKGLLKFMLVVLSLYIISFRKAKIVWMLHNIQPHEGTNWATKYLQNFLFRHSSLIVTHSKEAKVFADKHARCKVVYFCHPVLTPKADVFPEQVEDCDVLIWGSVLPYKGIPEFISKQEIQKSNLRIRIIGTCKDKNLQDKIKKNCNQQITFENRRIDFGELKQCIAHSRYVVFPYIGESVSSSGALIDTICLGGNPVGPDSGAFRDLADEGVCTIYHNDGELLTILSSESFRIKEERRQMFIKQNNWDTFAQEISNHIKSA